VTSKIFLAVAIIVIGAILVAGGAMVVAATAPSVARIFRRKRRRGWRRHASGHERGRLSLLEWGTVRIRRVRPATDLTGGERQLAWFTFALARPTRPDCDRRI
jgi:hypothetical protein